MKATVLDLRRRMRAVLNALERNEPVTILYRGVEKGVIYPSRAAKRAAAPLWEHPAFGLWKDREEMRDVDQVVRALRKGRFHAL